MESDDESRKIKKRGSIFRSRFANSKKEKEKEKDKEKVDKKTRSKSQDPGVKKEKVKEKKEGKQKEKEKEKEIRKLKKSHSVSGPHASAAKVAEKEVEIKPVFGVPLAEAVERSKMYDGVELPRVVRECLDYVEEFGLNYAGIYRLAGVKSKVEHLKVQYNTNKDVNLKDYDPTIATSLLKCFLRELPESVLTAALLPQFEEASKIEEEHSKLQVFQMVMQDLPPCNYALLSWMVVHLAHVLEMESETKMTIQNISIVMCPTMRISHRVLNLLFQHYKVLFKNVKIKRCKKLLKWHPNIVSELPDDPAALEEELQRHEFILNKMHDDLQKGVADKSTEDELWEVQRVVTQLKRKLRVSRRVSETKIAEKEKKEKKVKQKELRSEKKEPAPPLPAAAVVAIKGEKPEGRSPIRHAQKGPAPKAPIPELPPKQAERAKQGQEVKAEPEVKVQPPVEDKKEPAPAPPAEPVDKIEADLKKVAEKLEQEPPKFETESSVASSGSTKEEMEKIKNAAIKREFPEELTDSDSDDENDFEQVYDIPPAPIVAARVPDKQANVPVSTESVVKQEEDMEMIRLLLLSQAEVLAEQEELAAIRNELQKRIEAERQEIERLKAEVTEAHHKGRSRSSSVDSFEESLVSADSSSSESGDEEELMDMMNSLMLENQELERKNTLLSHDIHNEREAIVELKVKMKLIKDAGPSILADLTKAESTDLLQESFDGDQVWFDKDLDTSDSSVFDGGTRKQKAVTLPKTARPTYGAHAYDEIGISPGRKLERETSL